MKRGKVISLAKARESMCPTAPQPPLTDAQREASMRAMTAEEIEFDRAMGEASLAAQAAARGARRRVWKLPISAAGQVTFPRALLEAVQCWEGDSLAASVASDTRGGAILLRVMPHGLTRAEWASFERQLIRNVQRERKAGTFVPFNGKLPKG